MKAFYEDSAVVIYHGDCREIAPDVASDLVVTDPPYNVGYHYESYSDDLSGLEYAALLSVIVPPAVVIHYPEQSINLLPQILGECSETCAWIYNNPIPVPKDFRLITWWGIAPDFTKELEPYAEATISDKRAQGKLKEGRGLRDWWMNGQIRSPAYENENHPCQIPQKVINRILTITPGYTVLDPFMGSGTTLRAAKDLGRKAIGIEIEERYCEIAARRMEQEVLPLNAVEQPVIEELALAI